MTPIEILKLTGILFGIISFIAGIIVKFTTQSNKINELEKDINEIKEDMDSLEKKIDTLNTKVTALDSDIQIIKVTTEQTNNYVCQLLKQHNSDISDMKQYTARHEQCSNFQINGNGRTKQNMWDIADDIINDTYKEYNVRIYVGCVSKYFNTNWVSIHHILDYVKCIHNGSFISFKLLKMIIGQDGTLIYYDIDYIVGE